MVQFAKSNKKGDIKWEMLQSGIRATYASRLSDLIFQDGDLFSKD